MVTDSETGTIRSENASGVPVQCTGCGRKFLTQQSLGSHKQHCNGNAKVGSDQP